MPMYEVEHVCPLSPSQQKSIAAAIVKIHSETFTTPSLFVNVRFKDRNAIPLFVAGEQVSLLVEASSLVACSHRCLSRRSS